MSFPEIQGEPLSVKVSGVKAGPGSWAICWMLFAATTLNYMDRQAVTLVNPQIRAEFGLSQEGFGWVLAAFYLAYALFQVPSGFIADRGDLRRVYAGAVAWWSLSGLAMAFSPTLGILLALRASLGLGEAFNWPCALRITGRVLPPADRAFGNGIFNSGAAVGAVVTPLLIPPLVLMFDSWRVAFVVVGALGLVWVAAWLAIPGFASVSDRALDLGPGSEPQATDVEPAAVGRESRSPLPSTAAFVAAIGAGVLVAVAGFGRFGLSALWWGVALAMIGPLFVAAMLPEEALRGSGWAESLGRVVRLRRFWVLVGVSISINVCWHFLVGWLPTYLKTDRGMSYLTSGLLSALPFLAADAGNLGGGALSRWLAHRGLEPSRARVWVMAGCTLLISAGAWVGVVGSDTLTIALLGLMALGAAAFMANYFAFCQDVSARHTGVIVGILGGLGNLFAAGFAPIAGRVKDLTGGFGPVFIIVGLLPFAGLALLAAGWGHAGTGSDLDAGEGL